MASCSVCKERTDSLNEVDIANELVGDSEHRLRMLRKFQLITIVLQFVLSDLCIIVILSCFHNGSIFGPRWPEKRPQGIEFVNFSGGACPQPPLAKLCSRTL